MRRPKSEIHRTPPSAEPRVLRLLESVAQATGQEYFQCVTRELASALDVSNALVSTCIASRPGWLRTLSVWADGAYRENIDYAVETSVCARVLGGERTYVRAGSVELAPALVRCLGDGVQSYLGIPLRGGDDSVVGHLALFGHRTISDDEATRGLLRLLTPRIAAEIERRRMETRLREAERRYELATAAAPVGVWDWNLEAGTFHLEPNLKRILGFTDDEMPNDLEVWSSRIHPDDHERVGAEIQAHLEGSTTTFQSKHRMLHKDGSVRWVLARGTTFRNADGTATRMIGTDEDVTRMKEAEEALRASESRMRQLADALPVCISYVDSDLRYQFNNATYQLWHGIPARELRGKHVRDVLGETPFRTVKPFIDGALAGKTQSFDYHANYAHGKARDVHVEYVPDRNASGRVAGFHALIYDISERVESESQLRESQARLRTLAEGLSLADEETRHRISVGLHDSTLQSLAAIHIKLQGLRERLTSSDDRHVFQEACDLTRRVLVETRHLTFELSPPVLYELGLVAALESLCDETAHAELDVRFRVRGKVPRLSHDREVLVFQAVRELLGNVRQHASARQAIVTLAPRNSEVCIEVQDDGQGFAQSFLDTLGDETLPPARRARVGGLGLFGIQQRLDHVGGRMEIGSGPTRGAKVTLYVPNMRRSTRRPNAPRHTTKGVEGRA